MYVNNQSICEPSPMKVVALFGSPNNERDEIYLTDVMHDMIYQEKGSQKTKSPPERWMEYVFMNTSRLYVFIEK